MKFNKRELIKICNESLKTNTDVNVASAMYTDVELKFNKGGENHESFKQFQNFWRI